MLVMAMLNVVGFFYCFFLFQCTHWPNVEYG
jgi:hypothetical protein